jgi:hypothetical protein
MSQYISKSTGHITEISPDIFNFLAYIYTTSPGGCCSLSQKCSKHNISKYLSHALDLKTDMFLGEDLLTRFLEVLVFIQTTTILKKILLHVHPLLSDVFVNKFL